jgi:hypothetical protein
LLGRIYLNDSIYGKAAGLPFLILASRFIDTEPMQEYLTRFVKLAVKMLYDNLKAEKNRPRIKLQ